MHAGKESVAASSCRLFLLASPDWSDSFCFFFHLIFSPFLLFTSVVILSSLSPLVCSAPPYTNDLSPPVTRKSIGCTFYISCCTSRMRASSWPLSFSFSPFQRRLRRRPRPFGLSVSIPSLILSKKFWRRKNYESPRPPCSCVFLFWYRVFCSCWLREESFGLVVLTTFFVNLDFSSITPPLPPTSWNVCLCVFAYLYVYNPY